MKNNTQTKIFLGVIYAIVITISILLSFLWPMSSEATSQQKTLYIVFKCIAVAALAAHAVVSLGFGKRFSVRMPQTLLMLVFQLVPMLGRILYGNVVLGVIILLIVVLIFFTLYFLYGLSAKKFNEDEDRAKPSSNAQ